jgi:hypothetical protein
MHEPESMLKAKGSASTNRLAHGEMNREQSFSSIDSTVVKNSSQQLSDRHYNKHENR